MDKTNQRYEELDSIRGLASTTVVLHHFFLIFPSVYLVSLFEHSPIHILWAGHEAVMLFFVLSGFVLSLPFLNNKKPHYFSYFTKRITRIYIPYLTVFVIGIVTMSLFSRYGISELSDWFNRTWNNTLSIKQIVDHVTFLGDYKNNIINPVIWSLVHELRISIIFPLIMLVFTKTKWKLDLIILFFYSIGTYAFSFISYSFLGIVDNYKVAFPVTLHYVSFFIVGILLSKYRSIIGKWFGNLNRLSKIIMIISGILIYTYKWWNSLDISILQGSFVTDWSAGIGASIFIIIALYSKTAKKFLLFKPIHFLGKISYSLYLCHCVVLFTFINTFYGKLPVQLIIISAFISSIILSSISYRFVELNSIKLGKYLTTKQTQKSLKASA